MFLLNLIMLFFSALALAAPGVPITDPIAPDTLGNGAAATCGRCEFDHWTCLDTCIDDDPKNPLGWKVQCLVKCCAKRPDKCHGCPNQWFCEK